MREREKQGDGDIDRDAQRDMERDVEIFQVYVKLFPVAPSLQKECHK